MLDLRHLAERQLTVVRRSARSMRRWGRMWDWPSSQPELAESYIGLGQSHSEDTLQILISKSTGLPLFIHNIDREICALFLPTLHSKYTNVPAPDLSTLESLIPLPSPHGRLIFLALTPEPPSFRVKQYSTLLHEAYTRLAISYSASLSREHDPRTVVNPTAAQHATHIFNLELNLTEEGSFDISIWKHFIRRSLRCVG